MNLIEISCPADALDDEQRQDIAETLIANLLVAPDAPPEAVARAGRLTHVWFHGAQSWTTGGGRYRPGGPIPFVVTVFVPEIWREELSRHAMAAVRTALMRHVGRDALTDESTWITVVGIADGSIGLGGRPTTSDDLVRHLTRDVRLPDGEGLSAGVVIDPVCGMRVHLGPGAVTLDHDGQILGFCAVGCRRVYAADYGVAVG